MLGLVFALAACDGPGTAATSDADRSARITQQTAAEQAPTSDNAIGANNPAGAAQSPDRSSMPAGPATVLVLGDSISAAYGIQRENGWVALLQNHLRNIDEEFTVVNASISGETTGGGLARFAQSLEQHQPRISIIELGGNDGLRGYPLNQVRANLTALVNMAKAAGSRVLLLGMQIPPNYGARYSSGFAELFEEVASAANVALVPSFLERVALTPGMLQADGIHPVTAAQPLLLQTVLPPLTELLHEEFVIAITE